MKIKIDFVNQRYTPLIRNGKRVMELNYKINRNIGLNRIDNGVKTLIKSKYPNYKNLTFAVNVKIDNSNNPRKWFMTPFIKYEDLNLERQFNYFIDSWNQYYTEAKADTFQIILQTNEVKKIKTKKAGKDEHNDCLYNCILQSFGYNKELIASKIRNPHQLKKYLQYDRDNEIDLTDDNLKKIEDILKCSFTIRGDISYTSSCIKPININLTFKNNHVKLLCNENRNNRAYERKEENIYSVFYGDEKIYFYNGDDVKSIDITEYDMIHKSEILLIKSETKKNLKSTRDNYIERAEQLKKISNNLINYYKFNYESQIAYDIWRMQTKNINEPDELDFIEHELFNKSFRGGLHYCKERGMIVEDVIDYDMNQMYSYFMSSNNFTFPISKPEYKTLSEVEFENMFNEYFSYGLYNVVVSGYDKYLYLPTNKNIWITHYDLEILMRMKKVCVKIVQNNSFNCLTYSKRLTGKKTFSTYTNYMNEMINKETQYKDTIKVIRNSLWGYLSRKNTKLKIIKNDDEYDIDNEFLEEYEPKKNCKAVRLTDKNEIFKSPWCRMSIFLTAYCRLKMYNIIMDNDVDDNIIMVNTDGFISTTELKYINIGSKMGEFKIKNRGNAKIYNSNIIDWI